MSISRSQTGRKRIFLPSKLFLLIEAVLEKAEIDYFFIFSSILSLSASAYISSQLLSNFFPFSRPFSIFHLLWNSGERCEADGLLLYEEQASKKFALFHIQMTERNPFTIFKLM